MTFDEWWGTGRYGWTDETAGAVKDLARAAWYAGLDEGTKAMEKIVLLQRGALEIWKATHTARQEAEA